MRIKREDYENALPNVTEKVEKIYNYMKRCVPDLPYRLPISDYPETSKEFKAMQKMFNEDGWTFKIETDSIGDKVLINYVLE